MEWQKEAKSFDGIAAYAWSFNFLVRQEGSESIEGMVVTQGLLPGDRTATADGPHVRGVGKRGRAAAGDHPRLSSFGSGKFNGDPHIIGKTVRISRWETPPTVIGVMPPGVRFLPSPTNAQEPNYNVNALVDFWIPVTPNPERLKRPDWDVVARLRMGPRSSRRRGNSRSRRKRGASPSAIFKASPLRCNPWRAN